MKIVYSHDELMEYLGKLGLFKGCFTYGKTQEAMKKRYKLLMELATDLEKLAKEEYEFRNPKNPQKRKPSLRAMDGLMYSHSSEQQKIFPFRIRYRRGNHYFVIKPGVKGTTSTRYWSIPIYMLDEMRQFNLKRKAEVEG